MPETPLKFRLRPMLPADGPVLAEIFRASVEGLTSEDYDTEQQEAWMSAADDEADFAERLAGQLTLIATLESAPVAFASLKDGEEIDTLYVHPAVARQGAATMLVDALEKLAAARGAKRVSADASDSARPFFEERGYSAQHRNTVLRGGEWLSNTTMTKPLADESDAPIHRNLGGKRSDH